MKNIIFEMSSFVMFYVMLVILLLFRIILNSYVFSIINIFVFIIIFVIRIYIRSKRLFKLNDYEIDDKEHVKDAKCRGHQLGDIVAIICYLSMIIFMNNDFEKKYGDLSIFALCIGVYFAATRISISKNKLYLKVVVGLLSTVQGVVIIFSVIAMIIITILSLVNGTQVDTREFFKTFDYSIIIMGSLYLEEITGIIIFMMVVTIVLYIILIIMTPAYQIEKLSFAFKIVNILIVLGGIAIYFIANGVSIDVQNFVNKLKEDMQLFSTYFPGCPDEYKTRILSFGRGILLI